MSTWTDVRNTLEKLAPTVASAIGGPIAGIITAGLSGSLGVSNTPDAILNTLKNNPAAVNAVIKYESDNEKTIQDLVNAQAAEVQATQNNKPMEWGRAILVYICGAGFLYGTFIGPLLSGFFGRNFPQLNLQEIIAMLVLLLGHGLDKTIGAKINA